MPYYTVGASYILRQLPGSEWMGGLTVTLFPRQDSLGTLSVELTHYLTREPLEWSKEVQHCLEASEMGLRECAQEMNIELTQFDIRLDQFLYNPVDYSPRVFKQAGRSAFRAALEARLVRDL